MARVPLLIRLPDGVAELGARGRRVGTRVASSDLLPTLADLVGVSGAGSPGQSFAPLLFDAEGYGRRVVTSHSYSPTEPHFLPEYALWAEGYKYVSCSGRDDELYAAGALEEHDLSDERPVLAGWMREQLRRELGFDPDTGAIRVAAWRAAAASRELPPAVLEQMRALGYA